MQGMGKLAEALIDFDEAVQLSPGVAAFFRYGRLRLMNGKLGSFQVVHTLMPTPCSPVGTGLSAVGPSATSRGVCLTSREPSNWTPMIWLHTSREGTGEG